MRLFAALDLAHEHKRHLSLLRRPLAGVKWYPPESYHLTLRFIGDIKSRPVMEELDHALSRITAECFPIEPQGVGISARTTRSHLWAGVTPNAALSALQSKIETALRRSDFSADKRRFQPHISLGVFSGDPGADIIRWMQGNNLMRGKPIPASHFTLFRSLQTSGEPEYEACAEYPLNIHRPTIAV